MSFGSFGKRRMWENAFTGYGLNKTGHAITGGLAAGSVGANIAANKYFKTKIGDTAPGIHNAARLNYDMKANPTMGASGNLTLALSKFNKQT